MKRKIILPLTLCFCFLFFAEATGQCPMCRVGAESNLKAGGTAGKGLNTGIIYMLALPYLLVAGIGYIWWKNRSEQEKVDNSGESMPTE